MQLPSHLSQTVTAIHSTELTKHALTNGTLTARERQLLLLIDKHDALSVQAVIKMLGKVDLPSLAARGLVTYTHASRSSASEQPVATSTTPSQHGQKIKGFQGVNLNQFMSAYANDDETDESARQENQALPVSTPLMPASSVNPAVTDSNVSIAAIQPVKAVNDDFEDIMIAQGLLADF